MTDQILRSAPSLAVRAASGTVEVGQRHLRPRTWLSS